MRLIWKKSIMLVLAVMLISSLALFGCSPAAPTDVSGLEQQIADMESEISSLTQEVASLNQEISELEIPAAPTPTPTPTSKPASVSVSPVEATNPVKTQHTFEAIVKEADGSAAEGAEVQWILNRFADAVGDIVEVSNPTKLDNSYAISEADADGKATMTITSTREGDTDVTVFVPGIVDDSKHKVFAVKHWVDMMVDWPQDAVNKIGTDHTFSVKVYKATDKSPLVGVDVKWTITDDDPNLTFKTPSSASNSVTTVTNASGIATVTIQQATVTAGDNTVHMDVLSAGGTVLFSQDVNKKWLSPSLNILKEGPSSVELDLPVEYTITVRNDGAETANSVKVVDQIPEGLTFVSSTPSGTVSGATVTWNIGDLAPDASSKIVAKFTAAKFGEWTNTVTATSAEGITAQDSAALNITAEAGLHITKTGPATVTQGDDIEYTITVTNTGKIAAANTVVTDTIPAGLTYVSSTPSATVSGSTAKWSVGSLDAGDTKTFKITFTATEVGTLTNRVEATATDTAKAEAAATTEVVAPKVPNVSVTKSGPPTIYLDKTGQFTITVKNTGETTLTNVKVTDTLPANLSYVSSSPTGTVSGKTVTWTFASMAIGTTQTITLQAKSTGVGSFENSVSVTTTEGVSATAKAAGEVTAETGVTMQLIDTLDPVAVGSQTTYETTVTNQGVVAVHDLKIEFQLPDEVSFVSATGPTAHSVAGQTITFADVATLNAGQAIKFTVTVEADSAGNVVCAVTRSYAEFTTPVTSQEGTTIYVP
ncbi:MAG TPA: hypothetical protein DIT43_02720 [Dehalococcoidia bacterium]|nr:hypothetical protein [Dehalococcoidia bacterium]